MNAHDRITWTNLAKKYSKLQQKDIIHFSIYYHDFVYNVLRKNNEKRSGVAAVKRLRMLKVAEPTILQIVLFIEATQTHKMNSVTM